MLHGFQTLAGLTVLTPHSGCDIHHNCHGHKEISILIHGAIEGGKLGDKITLSLEELDIYPETIQVFVTDIQALIAAQGKATLELEEFIK